MYIYNVTTNVDESIHEKWLHWMKQKHIPEMLATGKFISAKMSQVMIEEEMGGVTYAVQYTTESMETLEAYYKEDAPKLRNDAMQLFSDKIVAFRTELKVIDEQFCMSVKKTNFMSVKAKKHLGQHFLTDELIAQQIADSLTEKGYKNVLEIGPGMGVLTKYLLKKSLNIHVIEIDTESVEYLQAHYLNLADNIISKDFLKIDLTDYFGNEQVAIIGNFPYNISTQIVFRTLENRHQIPEFAGMFQKEVALRIAEKEGSKVYGILSVLTQAFYDVEYLFTVPPTVFNPPPKVDSGVIRFIRKENYTLPVDEKLFYRVVKTAFQQRRKTLRNSLKTLNLSDNLREDSIFAKRPEQLSVQEFISLTSKIEKDAV